MEQQQLKFSCEECVAAYKEIHPDRSPPCGQCRPRIDERNWEAWEIYQFASMGPWGISMGEALELATKMGVEDPLETCIKVAEIIIAVAKKKQDFV
jgi:hypothetical protein